MPSAGRRNLGHLRVIDRLEVGAATVEPRRLVASYALTTRGKTERTELTYRFEEDLLDPRTDQNLADLIAVQVALNYGLFCDEIVLAGHFDRHDRRFIDEMAKNTAREIYVNKFLAPNPFLVDEYAGIKPIKRSSYLQAALVFSGPDAPPATRWDTAPENHAVLSSGGKESLLSYALLSEMQRQVAPVFVNESGRHWFSALNAYRHFVKAVPETARVWTDADRLFAWMLRRLAVIRPDFARQRSDAYPIRLWTVAVFLFGALPLLRRRRIGRLVLGDEHDSTMRATFHGIPHYCGLYDQSRYFDNAVSRFFAAKGWQLAQFSLLRPLSELLIEKVLVERYPDLQRLQISCHAAHTEGNEVRPCGRCEKCSRVIAMLAALDADPARCGYTNTQVDACLARLPREELHQERAAVQHLAALLGERGLLAPPLIGGRKGRLRPEVLQLRFDNERSPIDAIPTDLRAALYGILLEHAQGAARRTGRRWTTFDLLADPALHTPYPFSSPRGDDRSGAQHGHILARLSWPRARSRLAQVDVALLPVGATEQHGPHLPLDTDTFDAEHLATRVAEACSEPRPLVLPTIPYGVSYHHADFPGTIGVGPETLSRMVYEIGLGIARQGITKLVIVNGHGGNGPALHFAAQLINRDAQIFTCVDTGETSDPDIYALAETPNDVHAGEIETSTSLAARPELVDLAHARRSVPRFSSRYLDFSSKRAVTWYAHTRRISKDGTMGDPSKASAEKGERMWTVMIEHLARFVEELKSMSLDEIHQRHY